MLFLALTLAAASAPAEDFHVTAQVLSISKSKERQLYLYDGEKMLQIRDHSSPNIPCRCGDIVLADGFVREDRRHRPLLIARRLQVLGSKPLPPACETDARQLAHGTLTNHLACIRGVLASATRDSADAQWNWLVIKTKDGKAIAATTENEHPLTRLQSQIDAEVSISGYASDISVGRSSLAFYLLLFGKDGVVIRKPPTETPFAHPASGIHASLHRQCVSGVILGAGMERLFLKTDKGEIITLMVPPEEPRPVAGTHVMAAGFAESEPYGPVLVNSLIREVACPRAPLVPAERIDPRNLFADEWGRRLANYGFVGQVIRLSGTVENTAESIRSSGRLTLAVDGGKVTVDTSSLGNVLPSDFGLGYAIDIAGVCSANFEQSPPDVFSKFVGFTLYPRGPADLVILRRPPWWTPVRLMVIIGILLAVIVVILVWNRALKVLSERRGRELAREQLRHATSELKVEERTRLAVELHDSISQTLTGVALQIDAAQGSAESPSVSRRFLDTARAMLASCRQELRCCIWDLKSRTFDESDMTEAVTHTLAPHLGETETQVRFNVPRSILSESTAHDILRIIRELAVNAIRHGRTRHLRIAGEYRNGLVRFSVRDDGIGFDPCNVPGPAQGHFGLQGIRERISGRNGDMTVESAPGKGTKITVTFAPDEKDEDEP